MDKKRIIEICRKPYKKTDGYAVNGIDKVNIWYRVIGDENLPVITLIPGTEGSSVYWSEMFLSAFLENSYRVLSHLL